MILLTIENFSFGMAFSPESLLDDFVLARKAKWKVNIIRRQIMQ